jgi:hypothetical protein
MSRSPGLRRTFGICGEQALTRRVRRLRRPETIQRTPRSRAHDAAVPFRILLQLVKRTLAVFPFLALLLNPAQDLGNGL